MTFLRTVTTLPDQTETIVRRTIGCCLAVHRELGPGMSEGVYTRALKIERHACSIQFEAEKALPVRYRGHLLCHQRVDLYVEQQLVLEIKSVDQLHSVHIAQAIS
jgi:GxxExxY protein